MDELETLLRRYRASGPPPELRGRVLEAGRPGEGRLTREWLLPLGAAAATLVFYLLGSDVQRDLIRGPMNVDGDRGQAIAALTADFGGDDVARQLAERVLMAMEDAIRERAALPIASPDGVQTP